MVEWTEVVGSWGLVVMVKLGVPVVILFGLGHFLYRRHTHRRPGLEIRRLTDGQVQTSQSRGRSKRCWEIRRCSLEMRNGCPAYWRPDMPCWQAVKQASRGHIQSKCLGCSLLLSP